MPLYQMPPDSLHNRMEHLVQSKVIQVYGEEGIFESEKYKDYQKALLALPDNTAVTLYVNSPGGNFFFTEGIATQIKRLNVHCYVKFADSAAFEILLPACKRRFVSVESRLKFHDTQVRLTLMGLAPSFNEPYSIRFLDDVKKLNDDLAFNVKSMLSPDDGCLLGKEDKYVMEFKRTRFYSKIAGRKNECILLPLLLNLDFTAPRFMELTPKSKAFILLPKDEWLFPEETK
jgi:Clp protease